MIHALVPDPNRPGPAPAGPSLAARALAAGMRYQPVWIAGGAAAGFVSLVVLGEAAVQGYTDLAACFAEPGVSTCGHGFGCACHSLQR